MLPNESILDYQKVFADSKNYSENQLIAYGRLLRNILKMRYQQICDLPEADISIAKINSTIEEYIYPDKAKLLKLHYGLEDGVYRTYHEIAESHNLPPRLVASRITRSQNKLNFFINLFSKTYEAKYNSDSVILLKLSSASYLALLRAGIRTISELSNFKENDLLKIKGVGKVRAKEIFEKQQIFLKRAE